MLSNRTYPKPISGSRYSRRWSHPAELVDQACRKLFPLGFLACNIIYWVYYLEVSNFINTENNANQGKSVVNPTSYQSVLSPRLVLSLCRFGRTSSSVYQ